jgi:hypothetical protein
MRIIVKVTIGIIIILVALLFWAPWIINDLAVSKVVDKLGGPDARFHYLNQDMAIQDIPKQVSWLPFGRYVTFPGEAGWYVSFYGSIS